MTALDRFLTTHPADAGCARTLALLHVYAEAEEPERLYPGIAAHLRSCPPCAADLEALAVAAAGGHP